VFSQLVDLIGKSDWTYAVIFLFALLDVLVPLVPSETSVITAGVVAGAGDLSLPLVVLVAAAGAFAGDNIAYLLGRYAGPRVNHRLFKGEQGEKRLAWADEQLRRRGGELIVTARFIPAGRTLVTLTAGGLGMPWKRFALFDVIAGLTWALYASLLGYIGGKAFEHKPWVGLLLAVGIAFAVAGTIELVRRIREKRKAARASSPS
jgi:membrane protein DedA with SNARE-associated domain